MNNFTKYIFVIAVLLAFAPQFVFAHQPRIVKSNFVIINNPEVSQAFYGELKGTSTEFQIVSEKDFVLYTGILVPDIPNVKKDISVNIYMIDGTNKELVATLDGGKFDWAPYYEGFAKDNYFWGPEFKALNSSKDTGLVGQPMKGGDYRIVVYSPSNTGKYSLVVGYLESFPVKEMLNALLIVPQLKINFFNEPFIVIITNPFIYGPIILIIIVIVLILYILRKKK